MIAVETDAGSVPADAVILTPALPIIADILRPHVDGGLCRTHRRDRLSR